MSRKKVSKKVEQEVDVADLITQSEAAELLGKSLPAVNDLVRRGRLRSVEKFGRRLVFRSEVKALEDQRGWPKGKTRKAE